jgi:sugar phosphate isomerase/epimerase
LDVSHTAVSQSDVLEMLNAMDGRLAHLHIGDGTGIARDEHLVPGRGTQPCAEVLERIAGNGFTGHVIVEVNTRRAFDRAEREADLAEALAYCRLNLVAPPALERH